MAISDGFDAFGMLILGSQILTSGRGVGVVRIPVLVNADSGRS